MGVVEAVLEGLLEAGRPRPGGGGVTDLSGLLQALGLEVAGPCLLEEMKRMKRFVCERVMKPALLKNN